MSKEQTPITAEEIIDELIDIIKNPQNSNKEWVEAIIITAKEYDSNKVINAKVLEILRNPDHLEWLLIKGMELTKSNAKYETFDSLLTFIETEIKPKYK